MSHFDVAIIGLSCRFPGGSSVEEYWRLLIEGRDAVTAIPEDRWNQFVYYHPEKGMRGKAYSFSAGVLDNIIGFDADFFGISPREAEQMDPQQRLLLEVTWEALENAGQIPSDLAGSNCAVMVGISGTDYASARQGDPASGNAYFMLGSTLSIAANRISYLFDLKGPSMAIDTACSSSLVAFNEALNLLWSGRADLAVAGGVNLLASPYPFIGFSAASMLSEDGKCKAFSDQADGYVRGEGCGVFILKPLSDAIRDNDPIQAVVSGAGVNSDGRTNGIAMPSAVRQQDLLETVMTQFSIAPDDVIYFEAHGTGTAVGDPIETQALGTAIGKRRSADRGPLILGSAKTNIGHLEPASGMAGLVKAVQILKTKQIPKTLHCNDLNPNIDFEALNLLPARQAVSVEAGDRPMHVGVNSFGFGGTNATVFLRNHQGEEALPVRVVDKHVPPIVVSAKSEAALSSRAKQLANRVADVSKSELYDIAYTSAFKLERHEYRALAWGENAAELSRKLGGFADGEETDIISAKAAAPKAGVGFVFSGNGAQWPGMGREMYQSDAGFRASLDQADEIVRQQAGWSIIEMLFSDECESQLKRTEQAQPALFAIQIALCHCLAELGLQPDAVVGHSVGEVAAAYIAGAFDLEEAVKLILRRSEMQGRTRGRGKMAAMAISPEAALKLVERYEGRIELAARNSATSVTLTGDSEVLFALEQEFRNTPTLVKVLDLDYPFHSRFLDTERTAFLEKTTSLHAQETRLPFFSTVTGTRLPGSALDADYWWQNARQPVDFQAAIEAMAADGCQIFIEIGPHPVLQSYLRNLLRETGNESVVFATMTRGESGPQNVKNAADRAFVAGGNRDFSRWFQEEGRHVSLPPYPWHRDPHCYQPSPEAIGPFFSRQEGNFLGSKQQPSIPIWENQIDVGRFPFLEDHRVGGAIVLPATCFLEIALEASKALFGGDVHEIEDFEIRRPLVLDPEESSLVRFSYLADDKVFHLESRRYLSDLNWTFNAIGRLAPAAFSDLKNHSLSTTIPFSGPFSADSFYQMAKALGLDYGTAFQRLKDWTRNDGVGLINLLEPDPGQGGDAFVLDPISFDSCLQGLLAMMLREEKTQEGSVFLPQQLKSLKLYRPNSSIGHCRVRLERQEKRSCVASFRLYDKAMALVAEAKGFRFLRADSLKQKSVSARAYKTEKIPTLTIDSTDEIISPRKLIKKTSLGNRRKLNLNRLTEELAFREMESLSDEVVEKFDGWRKNLFLSLRGKRKSRGKNNPKTSLNHVLRQHPEALPEILQIGNAAGKLADILSGLQPAPKLSPSLKQQLLQCSPCFVESRSAILGLLQKVIETWPSNRRLRILDISPSSDLGLGLLNGGDRLWIDYTIAKMSEEDHSGQFTNPGAVKNFNVLDTDISGPLGLAELEGVGKFDVIVGAQISLDIGLTRTLIDNLSRLLEPQGIMIASDVKHQPWLDVAFGCCEEWWESDGHPALSGASKLSDMLPAEGFRNLEIQETEEQVLLVAQAPEHKHEQRHTPETNTDSKLWLIAANGPDHPQSVAEQMSQHLKMRGHRSVTVKCSDTGIEQDAELHINARDSTSWSDLLSVFKETETSLAGVILIVEEDDGWPLLQAAKALVKAEFGVLPLLKALRLNHQDGVSISSGSRDFVQASLGAGRVLKNEYPNLDFSYCELAFDGDVCPRLQFEQAVSGLFEGEEKETFVSDEGAFVPRLVERPLPDPDAVQGGRHYLDFIPGRLDALNWKQSPIPKPDKNQIVIETRVTGLNFRDVMFVAGILPEEALENGFSGPTIGLEASGVVKSVGRNVKDLTVGDDVICYAPDCFSTHILTDATAVMKKPARLTFEEAATTPTVFLTAYYALKDLARLQAGDRLLIHGAAGGVGLAAVQYAQHIGAEIYVTVGSPEKKSVMRLLGIPEDHVLDSRSLSFREDILSLTNGEGIDIVLNSLAGEAVHKSLDLLRPMGRFLELGKRDFYENNRIGLKFFRNNLTYFGIDLDQLMVERQALCQQLFAEVVDLFDSNVFHPLPFRTFDSSQVLQAFRTLQQSQHVGKILIRPPHRKAMRRIQSKKIKSSAAYMVTGGTGGFGLETARYLARNGAGALVLIGRQGIVRDTDQPVLSEIQKSGCKLYVRACDVTSSLALKELVVEVEKDGFPLKGLVHAASVFDDGLVDTLELESYQNVLRPKAQGAWTLHEVTKDKNLDFFVLYSSITTVFGNPGQANYVAANSELEYLAHYRNERNLPALAIGWGPIADAGYLVREPDLKAALEAKLGSVSLTSVQALKYLEGLLGQEQGVVHVAGLNWQRLKSGLPILRQPKYQYVAGNNGAQNEETVEDIQAKIRALDRPDAVDLIARHFLEEVAKVTGQNPDKIDLSKSLPDLGMDSLMGLELSHAVETRFGIELPAMSFSESSSISELSIKIYERLSGSSSGSDTTSEHYEALAEKHGTKIGPGLSDDLSVAVRQVKRSKG